MRNRELDRVDARKIGIVHQVLPARAALCALIEQRFQRVGYRIERRNAAQAERGAALFQALADFSADHGKQHEPRMDAHFAEDAIEMLLRPDHRPEVAHDIGVFELRHRRLGDHFQRFARGIRQKMKMKPLHGTPITSFRPFSCACG